MQGLSVYEAANNTKILPVRTPQRRESATMRAYAYDNDLYARCYGRAKEYVESRIDTRPYLQSIEAWKHRSTTSSTNVVCVMWANATGGPVVLAAFSREEQPNIDSASKDRAIRLAKLQGRLGVTTQVLAEILGVSRTQLYKWLDSNTHVNLQAESIARIKDAESIATTWTNMNKAPLGSYIHEPTGSGEKIIDLVKRAPENHEKILSAFQSISLRLLQQKKENKHQRRPSHRSLPSDE